MQGSETQLGRVYLLNRMMLAIATRVKAFSLALFGEAPSEVDEIRHLPNRVDYLVVGRQHMRRDGSVRYGHEIVAAAAAHCEPRAVVYVIPGTADSWLLRRDLDTIRELAERTPTFLLEFARLRELSPGQAAELARPVLADPGVAAAFGDVRLLLDPRRAPVSGEVRRNFGAYSDL